MLWYGDKGQGPGWQVDPWQVGPRTAAMSLDSYLDSAVPASIEIYRDAGNTSLVATVTWEARPAVP